jgi:hypothetical protein
MMNANSSMKIRRHQPRLLLIKMAKTLEDDGDIRHWPPEEDSQLKYEELKDFGM